MILSNSMENDRKLLDPNAALNSPNLDEASKTKW